MSSSKRGELSLMISSRITPSTDTQSCPEGFTLQEEENGEGPLCLDNDECLAGGTRCSHECINSVGGYFCECPHGYEITKDGVSCQGQLCLSVDKARLVYQLIRLGQFASCQGQVSLSVANASSVCQLLRFVQFFRFK